MCRQLLGAFLIAALVMGGMPSTISTASADQGKAGAGFAKGKKGGKKHGKKHGRKGGKKKKAVEEL
jgi:hypothetical protein